MQWTEAQKVERSIGVAQVPPLGPAARGVAPVPEAGSPPRHREDVRPALRATPTLRTDWIFESCSFGFSIFIYSMIRNLLDPMVKTRHPMHGKEV